MTISPRWLVFIGMALILCSFVANIIEEADPIGVDDTTIFTIIQSFNKVSSTGTAGIISTSVQITPQAITLLLKMLFWDYNFLHNFLGTLIRLLMMTISFMFMIWLALLVFNRN